MITKIGITCPRPYDLRRSYASLRFAGQTNPAEIANEMATASKRSSVLIWHAIDNLAGRGEEPVRYQGEGTQLQAPVPRPRQAPGSRPRPGRERALNHWTRGCAQLDLREAGGADHGKDYWVAYNATARTLEKLQRRLAMLGLDRGADDDPFARAARLLQAKRNGE